MAATHAQIAKRLLASVPAAVLEQACKPVVTRGDYSALETMLPGVKFDSRKVAQNQWELVGACEDGSILIWRLGDGR